MSFHNKTPVTGLVAIAIAMLPASVAFATNANATLTNFSIGATSAGDVYGNGHPNTIINATKDAFNNVELSTGTIGTGCGTTCLNQMGQAAAHVGEQAFLNTSTLGEQSGELFGSGGGIALEAQTQLTIDDVTLRDLSMINAAGSVYGVAIGDETQVFTQRNATGAVTANMAYHDVLCPDLCGSVDQSTTSYGMMHQVAKVYAHGAEAVAISNVTDSTVSALLENYKGATE